MSDQATKEELDALVKQFQTLKDHSARVDFLRKNPNALRRIPVAHFPELSEDKPQTEN